MHYWIKGFRDILFTPNPFRFGLVWGEGYYEIYHCFKCMKHTTFKNPPINFNG